MKQNKRFILLVVMVLLANCLFAGLASAATGVNPVKAIYVMEKNASKITLTSAKEYTKTISDGNLDANGNLATEQSLTLKFEEITNVASLTPSDDKNVYVAYETESGSTTYGFKVTSSDPSVIYIDGGKLDGTVAKVSDPTTTTALNFRVRKFGSSTITVTAFKDADDYAKDNYQGGAGKSASFTLTVAKLAPTNISLKAGKESYEVGASLSAGILAGAGYDLVATVTADAGAAKTVTWESSDSSIALFDGEFSQYAWNDSTNPYGEKKPGHFSLLKAGEVTITAKSSVDGKILDKTTVKVTAKNTTPIKAIKFTPAKLDYATVAGGSGIPLEDYMSYDPSSHASIVKKVWTSSNENILKVGTDGKATAAGTGIDGTVTVTVVATDSTGASATGTVEINVVGQVSKLNKLWLDKNTATIYYKNADEKAGTTLTATTSETAITIDAVKVTWATSDASVAIIEESSKNKVTIVPVKVGNCTITCTATDGTNTVSDKCEILVQGEGATAEGKIVLPKTSGTIRMIKGKTKTTKINAVGNELTYIVDDEKIATVDAKGVVTAVGSGTAKITIKDKDGNFRVFSCVVKQVPVKKLVIENKSFSLKVGKSKKIGVTALPEYAYDKTVTYTSSDEKVATVDAKGKVTAVGKGKVKITVAAGEKTKTVTVKVK
jgi:uncharacterized protein YjdB